MNIENLISDSFTQILFIWVTIHTFTQVFLYFLTTLINMHHMLYIYNVILTAESFSGKLIGVKNKYNINL